MEKVDRLVDSLTEVERNNLRAEGIPIAKVRGALEASSDPEDDMRRLKIFLVLGSGPEFCG